MRFTYGIEIHDHHIASYISYSYQINFMIHKDMYVRTHILLRCHFLHQCVVMTHCAKSKVSVLHVHCLHIHCYTIANHPCIDSTTMHAV